MGDGAGVQGREVHLGIGVLPVGVRLDQGGVLSAREAAVDQVAKKRRSARLVLLGALDDTKDLAITIFGYADGNQYRYIAHLIGPGAL